MKAMLGAIVFSLFLLIKTMRYWNSSERLGPPGTSLERCAIFRLEPNLWRHPHAVLSQMQPKPVIAAGVFVLVPTVPCRDENGGWMVQHFCRVRTLAGSGQLAGLAPACVGRPRNPGALS